MGSFDYPVVQRGAKVGIHSLRPANVLNHVRAAQARGVRFPAVKGVDDVDWLIDVKQLSGETVTIARFEIPGPIGEGVNGIESVNNGDYSRFVNTLFEPIERKLNANPNLRSHVDYWEICNEPDPPEADGYRKLSECMIACMRRAEQMGLKLAIFAWNAGTPEFWELEATVATGVFGHAQRNGHIMTLHEGVFFDAIANRWMEVDTWFGQPIPATQDKKRWVQLRQDGLFFFDHVDDNPRNRPAFWNNGTAGPLCFRYRYLYELLKRRGEVIPLVISELVYGFPGYENAFGVRDAVAWYDAKAAEDYYVWGHLPFTLGSFAGHEWEGRDYEFAYQALIDMMKSVENRINATAPVAPPPTPEPPPPLDERPFRILVPILKTPAANEEEKEPPSEPPTDEARVITVNLIPKMVTLNERLQVLRATHWQKETILQSAMDSRALVAAGLDGSFVKVWEPNRWSQDIRAFMALEDVLIRPVALPQPELEASVSPWEDPRRIGINLLPPNSTLPEKEAVTAIIHRLREGMTQSADDAIAIVRLGTAGSRVKVWEPDRWQGDVVAWLLARDVDVEVLSFPTRRRARIE